MSGICIASTSWADVYVDDQDRKEWDECKSNEERHVIMQKPKYSAIYGDWKDLCAIYLFVSANEHVINDGKNIIEKCKEFGVDLEYDIDPYLPHATVVFAGFFPEIGFLFS